MAREIITIRERVPLVDSEVERRSKANGTVKTYTLSPEELEQLRQQPAPKVKFWEPTLTREQYLELRAGGASRDDIKLKWFNNEPDKLTKQLRAWKLLDQDKEAEEMAVKQLEGFTRDEYLSRRVAGETRTRIMNSLNARNNPFYKLLEEWGLKDKEVERMELAALAAAQPNPAPTGEPAPEEAAPAESIAPEQADTEAAASPEEVAAEAVAPLPVGSETLQRLEQQEADRERKIRILQQTANHWTDVAEREQREREREKGQASRMLLDLKQQKDAEIARLNGIVTELTEASGKAAANEDSLRDRIRVLEQKEKELCALQKAHDDVRRECERLKEIDERECTIAIELRNENERLKVEARAANDVVEALRTQVRGLEAERERNQGFAFFRIPVRWGDNPARQRVDLLNEIERFVGDLESADSDRKRTTAGLFRLLQSYVGLVAAELSSLHPVEDDVTKYAKRFFAFHNQQHQEAMKGQERDG